MLRSRSTKGLLVALTAASVLVVVLATGGNGLSSSSTSFHQQSNATDAPEEKSASGGPDGLLQMSCVNDVGATPGELVPRETILKALLRWVKANEGGSAARVADARDVFDTEGSVVGLNVVLTSNPEMIGERSLQMALEDLAIGEETLREAAAEAMRAGNTKEYNRVIGDIAARRREFSRVNGFRSYRLGRRKDGPPMLSHWQGIPFETARFNRAHELARGVLAEEVEFSGLVQYTAVSSLLRFVTARGNSILVDPVNMKAIESAPPVAQSYSPRGRDVDDSERRSRTKSQWEEFLGACD